MSTPAQPSNPLRSELSSDPDMREIIQLFIDEMPERVAQLEATWKEHRMDDLRRLAHQLKGSGGGYGYPTIGAAAGSVESLLTSMGHGAATGSVENLRKQFEDLTSLCRRVAL